MLIYNYQKEFLGMDEKDLKTLGFQDLASLRTEVTDFADLFVKTPGYIHNFKHVHWIDFITCAESNEESKVIINVNNKNFKCIVQITSAFLVDNPSSKAYLVTLNNLRELTHKESESIAGDIIERQAPQAVATPKPIFNTPEYSDEFEEKTEVESPTITPDPYETPLEVDLSASEEEILPVDAYDDELQEESLDVDMGDHFEEQQEPQVIQEIEDDFTAPLAIDIEEDLEIEDVIQEPAVTTQMVTENFDNGYVYDPTVASDELGLPLDLIEEFIQDFIEQAKEFKKDLYQSLEENDLDQLKIQSHKLKGVAANLRIEDALEALTIINTSSDTNTIKENLDILYKIIAKLAGEEIHVEKEIETPTTIEKDEVEPLQDEEEEELLTLDFKEEEEDLYSDPIEVEDSQVPQKIELPELADDTFGEEPVELDNEELKIDIDLDEEITLDVDEELEIEEPLELEIEPEPEIEYSKVYVANEIGLDSESFTELFSDYIQEANNSLQVILDAVTNNDFNTSKNEALKLKGMSDNMRVTSFSSELEALIHTQDELEATQLVSEITTAITQLSNIGD